jgi:RHS repeat-associated protein
MKRILASIAVISLLLSSNLGAFAAPTHSSKRISDRVQVGFLSSDNPARLTRANVPPLTQINQLEVKKRLALFSRPTAPALVAKGVSDIRLPRSTASNGFQMYLGPRSMTLRSTLSNVVSSSNREVHKARPAVVSKSAAPQAVALASPGTTGFDNRWSFVRDGLPGVGDDFYNVGTGNFIIQVDDMTVNHKGIALDFRRTYNSLSKHDYLGSDGSVGSNYGDGWTNSFDSHIALNSGKTCSSGTVSGISVFDVDGARYDYLPDCNGNYVAPAGQFATLAVDSSGTGFLWTKKSGTSYDFYTPNQAAATAGLAGRVREIYGRNENSNLLFSYTWDNGNASSIANLNQISVTPEFASSGSSGSSAVLTFADFYVSSCKPPKPCTKIDVHRLLSSLTWPDGTLVTYNYAVGASTAALSLVSQPGNNASSGSCSSGQSVCRLEQYAVNADGQHISAVYSPNGYQTTTAGGDTVFGYNSDFTLSASTAYAVVNFTPADGYSIQLQSGYPTTSTELKTSSFSRSSSLTTVSDTDGHKTIYTFDSLGRVTEVQQVVNSSTTLSRTMGYSANNTLLFETDTRGERTDYETDAAGNVIAVALPSVTSSGSAFRPTSLYSYDAHSNLIAYCDPVWSNTNGHNWSSAPAVSDSLCPTQAGVAQYTWTATAAEPFGELTSSKRPSGYAQTFSYSSSSQGGADYGQVTDVLGTSYSQHDGTSMQTHLSFTYDKWGNVATFNKGNGATTIAYDGSNRPTEITDPDSVSSYKYYYVNGDLSKTETAAQHAGSTGVTYTYDTDRNEVSEVHHFGGTAGTTQKFYDGADRLVESVLPHDSTDYHSYAWAQRYLYDLTKGGTVSITTQNASSPTISGLSAYGNVFKTQLYYQPPSISGTGLQSLAFYDTLGQTYDGLDRPISSYDVGDSNTAYWSATPTRTMTYDGSGYTGLLSEESNGAGQTENLVYDADERVMQKTYSSQPNVSFTFDADGHTLSSAQTGVGTESYTYSVDGIPTTHTTPAYGSETSSTVLTASFYPDDRRSGLSVNTGNAGVDVTNLYTFNYRADGATTSESVALGSGETFAYTYTSAGRILTKSDPATGTSQPVAAAVKAGSEPALDLRAPAAIFERNEATQIDKALGLPVDLPSNERPPLGLAPPSDGFALNGKGYVPSLIAANHRRLIHRPKSANVQALANDLRRTDVTPEATSSTFQPTTFTYNSYGQIASETLPTGEAYTSLAYDPEDEVTSFDGYGSSSTSTELVRNAYNDRSDLVGHHFYANGGSNYDTNWPHFSGQADFGVILPTSESVQAGTTLCSGTFEGDGLNALQTQYLGSSTCAAGSGTYVQGYDWLTDGGGRRNTDNWSQEVGSTEYRGQVLRAYDIDNHMLSWTVSSTANTNNGSVALNGWPVASKDANVNIACNGAPPTKEISLYAPGTELSYAWNPAGQLTTETVHNVVPSSTTTKIALHWDGDKPLFTTDVNGKVDSVRVGLDAIITPSGTATMLDRDWSGSWVLTHSKGGFSTWSPPDPYLQNCTPNNPPPGSSKYAPVGFPLQFAQLSSDTITDGYNFFSGVRNYDPAAAQWTSPDALSTVGGSSPNLQQPYVWNHNNPTSYSDPSGYCEAPSGTGTRVCVDFFIQGQFALPLLGDDRGFSAVPINGSDSYRVQVNLDFDDGDDSINIAHSHWVGGFDAGQGSDHDSTVKYDPDTQTFTVHIDSGCGPCDMLRQPSIKADFTAQLNDDGTVTISGKSTEYPSLEAYEYDDSGIRTILQDTQQGTPPGALNVMQSIFGSSPLITDTPYFAGTTASDDPAASSDGDDSTFASVEPLRGPLSVAGKEMNARYRIAKALRTALPLIALQMDLPKN